MKRNCLGPLCSLSRDTFSPLALPEYPPLLPAHGAALLSPSPGVVRHDARVPVESHHSDRERRPRGESRAEKTGNPAGRERDEGEMRRLPTLVPQRVIERVCVSRCVFL